MKGELFLIKFVRIIPKKLWKIFNDGEEICELGLSNPSSISNKFEIITNFVEDMANSLGEEFEIWFIDFFSKLNKNTCNYCRRFNKNSKCVKVLSEQDGTNKKKKFDLTYIKNACIQLPEFESYRRNLILKNIKHIIKYVDRYFELLNFDFSIFVNEEKVKKTSIFFNAKEIEKIMKLSSCLKIYSLIFNSDLKLDIRVHKEIFNILLENIDKTIIDNIFEIIRTKTFRYKQSDRFMWKYIALIQCKEIEVHIIEIFNFLMNNIMVLCKLDKNPITYFVTVVNSAIEWILRSVYTTSIIYSDEISSDEIQTIKINNLLSYSYNDTLGRIKIVSYNWAYKKIEDLYPNNINEMINEFHERMKTIKQESPLINYMVYPVLSNLTDIPYHYFKTLNFEQSIVLSAYLGELLKKSFDKRHQCLFKLLSYYPDPSSHVPISTSYKVKYVTEYVNLYNNVRDFMGFDTCNFQKDIYGHIIGRLIRVKFRNIFTGEIFLNLRNDELEKDIIQFYTYYFSKVYHKSVFIQMKNHLYKLF